MVLVDSHCHLDLLSTTESIDDVVARASNNGVKYLQTICTTFEAFPAILKIAQSYEHVYASVGVHPDEIKNDASIVTSAELIKLSGHPKVIGIGETGKAFREHIIASQATNLPVIVHTRDAEDDTAEVITNEMKNSPFPGLIHCFTASKDFARKMLDQGIYISIAGIVTFKNATALKEIATFVPLDCLLIETDSPYLAPVPMRGKQNEPAFVRYVAEYIAQLKGLSADEVAKQTTDNFFTLFSKSKR